MSKELTRDYMINEIMFKNPHLNRKHYECATDRYLKFHYDVEFNGLMDKPKQEDGCRLFGIGNLYNYGGYTLVVASSKDEARDMFLQNMFKSWLQDIVTCENDAHFNEDGEPLNGMAHIYLEYKNNGIYELTDDELFNYYKEHYPITDNNIFDLQTRVWDGSND